ncbi:5-formyltetrahydrofolate cyclo-ligase [Campylobacter sp. 19-13652]|uniref:5-formyltetrahydrofolate cyclo-ligase n=1 Tax=Campylobacter sp. 19-13652 TaxID=2840180 RepID=UPI001C75A189|nr:5-formyltetrahydrofolate cyclo-ligase [Campylobacter sp. 19-13652]BCX79633.1 5-formyltetrahydrofolate cyclo-ligase [Campylobacter sp. 19-13652]
MSVKFDKKELRERFLRALKSQDELKVRLKSHAICARLKSLIKASKARSVLLYLALDYEIDVYSLRRECARNCEILSPFMAGLSLKMVKLRLPLRKKRFNVRESAGNGEFKARLDLAIVPAVAVDANMARIGHGAGFYDRFFAGLRYRPKLAFVSALDNFAKAKVSLKHDVIGDFYLTPGQNYIKRGKNDRGYSRLARRCSGRRSWVRVR